MQPCVNDPAKAEGALVVFVQEPERWGREGGWSLYLYGFLHVSTTERLHRDTERLPCWIQVVVHHLGTLKTRHSSWLSL